MIGRLKGILVEKHAPEVLIDVGGVGYELQMPLTSFYELPLPGAEVIVYTHFVVREDAQLLYGFIHKEERSLFRLLIKANGVGPKLALTILSGMTAKEFIGCLERDDIATLIKLPGVGKKTAERLLVEMRDKLKSLMEASMGAEREFVLKSNFTPAPVAATVEEDAIAALLSLGYKPQQASKAVSSAFQEGMDPEQLIKAALKSML
ncbi:Holliday junction branch migration protein RuvA [Shewanella amazonensis]|jgi:Holliday junction DNA helicase RuvA|uniref:Holliday junction branch migration complex subunit RuvA n=2 Tax=Shewanella TaxID=22 RepID=RUVA_SHEAM|nr:MULTISPECIES: Holliday junction branch migration protein RuvA [Shewanella]A1S6N9.1 RecName: Full=Holliday junction branch migration complex subunit RuvA [Shewanella amazonensis SB2B]ABM00046.1 Holliday junction DNA helicase RuvA [Shewanella amazonensis SB2B]MCH4294363.1 Holliday junction branch migration protein RuvA [Shewanella zhuhaiensis]QYJ73648.1 Holliday junction branch migration protein RuvA [Shewanella sp. FJAT-52076]QYK03505.1 Holliday junction branch migration protein RuvA [Shewan